MTALRVLSLFTGIGGIDLGLQRAGMTIAGQVEIDPWCRTILEKHWPEVPRHDDVRTAAGWWGSRPVDLVCGGFPCQPVSVAGRHQAQADDRWLWPAFAQGICDLRPRWVLVENVPGLLARGMGDVLGDLASLGYDAEWDCVPAAFVGAPHVRRRVFLVAYTDGAGLSERRRSEPVRTKLTAPERRSETVADADRGRRDRRSRLEERQPEGRTPADGHGAHVADAGSRRHRAPQPLIFTRRHSPVDRSRWPTEPDVGRVAHGIPRRVDRLRGLGNAVVPQVVEHIGRLIIEADNQ